MPSIVPSTDEQWVLDLWQWIGRALQYSVGHPVAMLLGAKTHDRLTHALVEHGSVSLGIFKDGLTIGTVHATNPGVKTRMAPYLHERGAVLVRFLRGVTLDELTAFVGTVTLPVHDVFAGGGLRAMVGNRGVLRVHVEELAHDLLEQEREEDRRIRRLRDLFLALLGTVTEGAPARLAQGDLVELLDEPKLLARMFEQVEPPKALSQVLAGFADLVLEKEAASGESLRPKLQRLLLTLAPEARDRLVLGFAALDPVARRPLSDVLSTLSPHELADLCFPGVRYHAQHLDRFYFAMRAVVPDAGMRIEVLRRIARLLHDLPLDEPATFDVMTGLSEPPRDGDTFRFERAVVTKIAARIKDERAPFRASPAATVASGEGFEPPRLEALDHRVALEMTLLGARLVDFSDVAARAPALATALARAGRVSASAGIARALSAVEDPRWRPATEAALRALVTMDGIDHVVRDLDKHEERLEEFLPLLRVLAPTRADLLFGVLEKTPSRKLRRMLLEALSAIGPPVLPLVRQRFAAPEWYVVRNMVTLAARVGAQVKELAPLARHANGKVRLEVARALRAMGPDPLASEVLAPMLRDASEEVQIAAALGLGEVALGASAIQAIEALVLDEARSEDARRRAVEALGRSLSDDAANALVRLLEPRGLLERPFLATVRERAAIALHRSRAPSAAALFARAAQSPTYRVRKACERALEPSDG